jgi:primosomal protein N' (replication factor Y)
LPPLPGATYVVEQPSAGEAPPHAPPRYAEVVVDAHTTIPDDRFTYEAPAHLALRPGHLVRVPFGQRTVHGVVVALTDDLQVDYVRPVLGLLHPEPVVDDVHIELARWIASYYITPLFDALAPMLPPGFRARSRPSIRLVEGAPLDDPVTLGKLTPGARRLLTYLRANPRRPRQLAALTRTLGPWVPNAARALIHARVAEEHVAEPATRSAQRLVQVVRPLLGRDELAKAAADSLARAPKQAALVRKVAEPATVAYEAIAARAEFGASALASLVRKGLLAVESVATSPTRSPGAAGGEPPLLPTGPQVEALARINAAQGDPARQPRTFLLHGVTGSGKTEVYLQALAHCMGIGKRAIVLVPELSLTPQTMKRFEARFPGQVALLQSGLKATSHWETWWQVHGGARGIVVGPRSALFAPQRDLGLIILDEEHEWTYKQVDPSPRYHARDAARELARLTGAVVVLGSATPDIATAYDAERGAIERLSLPSRIERSGAPTSLAEVRVVDMRDELKAGNRGIFSRALHDSLRRTLADGKQAILFLNRRGSGGIVECRNCGHVMRCPRCATPFTLHSPAEHASVEQKEANGHEPRNARLAGTLLCHHCNRRRGVPARCPNCRSPRIRSLGLGTQRLVEEVHAMAPSARVLRWDRDAAPSAAAHAELLERFESGEADVLVGTQMIAKGLDIASVTLVGVVLADLGLHMPDYRAPERTFQLLTQVAGRAGRGATRGVAIIQTYAPEHYAVQAAARQDYEGFYEREMAYRRAQGNPPAGRLVRLLFGHGEAAAARAEAVRLAALLRKVAREWDMTSVDVVGPAPAYPPRVRGAWRWHIYVRGPEQGQDPRILLEKVVLPPAWTIDVDPVGA